MRRVICLCPPGNYTCEVEWSGQPKQIAHHLEVQVPPQIEAILPGGFGQVDNKYNIITLYKYNILL